MKLYAGNLSSATTETMLKDAFAAHGSVEECRIPTDKTTGASKPFGFVSMPVETEAKAAITALNDSELAGSKITVKESNQERKSNHQANSKS